MKRLLTITGLVAATALVIFIGASGPAGADVVRLGSNPTVLTDETGNIPTNIVHNTTGIVTNGTAYCGSATYLTVQWYAELTGAGTTANTLTLQQSVDGNKWSTLTAFAMTPAGTTGVTVCTNITVGGIPYVRAYSIANANANTGDVTNCTVWLWVK